MKSLTSDSRGPAGDLAAYANELAHARAQALIVLYANDPRKDWMPPDLRGRSLSDGEVQTFLGQLAGARDMTAIDPTYQHNTTALNQIITSLRSIDAAFDDQQIAQQVRGE